MVALNALLFTKAKIQLSAVPLIAYTECSFNEHEFNVLIDLLKFLSVKF